METEIYQLKEVRRIRSASDEYENEETYFEIHKDINRGFNNSYLA